MLLFKPIMIIKGSQSDSRFLAALSDNDSVQFQLAVQSSKA